MMRSVCLLVALMLMFSCTREDSPNPENWIHQYAEKLNRNFNWKRSFHYYNYSGTGTDTTITLPDTSFPIVVLNDTTLVFLQDTLSYTIHYPSQGVNWLVDTAEILHYVDSRLLYPHDKTILDYYYNRDSVCVSYSSGGNGGGSTTSYKTRLN